MLCGARLQAFCIDIRVDVYKSRTSTRLSTLHAWTRAPRGKDHIQLCGASFSLQRRLQPAYLFMPQRDHRIHPHRPERRNQAT
jgi:hypothetical protein